MQNPRNPKEASRRSKSFISRNSEPDSPHQWNGEYGFDGSDRRLAFTRQSSFHQSIEPHTPISIISNDSVQPLLSRSVSSIKIPPTIYPQFENEKSGFKRGSGAREKTSFLLLVSSVFRIIRAGNRPMKRLLVMISLNVAYSSAELFIGLLTGRVGLVSDAFHLTFGCGLLTFSLFAMAASRRKLDGVYTYGYRRLEVLSAFTNALFLLFMAFSLAVEALHAFIQDESEHKHYLIVSAVTNLLVNLLGVWFFRNYARVNLGIILASWFLTLGVKNAEVLCLGLVSVVVFMLVIPLFRTTGGILLQMAPNIPTSALNKCLRQITLVEDVSEIVQARFWELIPGHVVGSVLIQVKKGADHNPILHYVHSLYHDLGVQDLTVQLDEV